MTTSKLYSYLLDVLYILLIVGAGFFSFSKIFDSKVDLNGDNIYYYSLGQALFEGKGYVDIISGTPAPHTHFPVGYPYFVSKVMQYQSTDIQDVKWANGYLFLLCLVLLYFIFKQMAHRHLAFAACLLTALNVHILGFATIMMSDIVYLFASSVCFLLLLHLRAYFLKDKSSVQGLVLQCLLGISAVVFVVISYYVRGIGISLLVAAFGFFFFEAFQSGWLARWTKGFFLDKKDRIARVGCNHWKERRVWRYFLLAGLLALVFLCSKVAWQKYMKGLGLQEQGSGYFGFLGMKTGGGQMENWSDWAQRIESNLTTYIPQEVLSSTFFPGHVAGQDVSEGAWLGGIAFLLVIVFGIWHSGKGRWLFLFYLGCNCGILLLWPEQWGGTRFLISLIPYLLFFFMKGVVELLTLLFSRLKFRPSSKITEAVVGFFLLICVLPAYMQALDKREKSSRLKDYSIINASPAFVEYKQMVEYVALTLPDTAVVACRKPEIAYIFSKRTHYKNIPYYGTEDEVYQFMIKEKVDYVIIDHWFGNAFRTVYPAIVGKYKDHFEIVHWIRTHPSDQQSTPTLLYRFKP